MVQGSKIQRKSAIFHTNPDKIDEKWDTIWNNGFGLGPQNLIIKSMKPCANNEPNYHPAQTMKPHNKIELFLNEILRKFNENDPIFEWNSGVNSVQITSFTPNSEHILVYKLLDAQDLTPIHHIKLTQQPLTFHFFIIFSSRVRAGSTIYQGFNVWINMLNECSCENMSLTWLWTS